MTAPRTIAEILIPAALASSYAFGGVGFSGSVAAAHPLEPSAPRTVTIQAAAAPPVIRTGLGQATLIELPEQEKVATVFVGNDEDWVFNGGKVASRYVSVKPKAAAANATTNMHIISDHGNEYTLQLREVSRDEDSHFDSNVRLAAGDKAAQNKMSEMPAFVPAAEVDGLKKQVAEAQAKEAEEKKTSLTAGEQYRAKYPTTMHFDFTWDKEKGAKLGVKQIWRDDRFTYIQGNFEETPALYELKDGKGSLINADFANGLYTVPKSLQNGYLTIGKVRVDFRRAGQGV